MIGGRGTTIAREGMVLGPCAACSRRLYLDARVRESGTVISPSRALALPLGAMHCFAGDDGGCWAPLPRSVRRWNR